MSYLVGSQFLVIPSLIFTRDDPPSNIRGVIYGSQLQYSERIALSTDPTGIFTLILTNLVIGSRVLIVDSLGVQRVNQIIDQNNVTLNINVYALSTSNILTVKIGKSSEAPFYRRYETQVIAAKGTQSIFVNQERDDI